MTVFLLSIAILFLNRCKGIRKDKVFPEEERKTVYFPLQFLYYVIHYTHLEDLGLETGTILPQLLALCL